MRRREFIALMARVSHRPSRRWRRGGADLSRWGLVRRSTHFATYCRDVR